MVVKQLYVCVIVEQCDIVLDQQSDEPAAVPSAPQEAAAAGSQCHSPSTPCDDQDKRESRHLRFVDAVTSAK